MQLKIAYSQEKNELLKKTRGVCFEDIVKSLTREGFLDVLEHHNPSKYPNQKILVVKIKDYAYAVPYVFDNKKKQAFLKTVYPDRNLTEKYLKDNGK